MYTEDGGSGAKHVLRELGPGKGAAEIVVVPVGGKPPETFLKMPAETRGRMVAALTRVFGVQNLPLVEDVVQDALCRALEVWKFRGVPEQPSAWLMATAKNRALDVLRRRHTASASAPELARFF